MQEPNEHWIRLSAVIAQADMSTNYFARYIGLPVAENLYRIKRGQNGISRDVAERIVAKFPKISKGWLMTGEGSMYLDERLESSQVPFYERAVGSLLTEAPPKPNYYLFLPPLRDCDMAVRYGDDILILKKCAARSIPAGRECLIPFGESVALVHWTPDSSREDEYFYVVRGRLTIYPK